MLVLNMFFGIIVRMYREIGGRHNFPHVHAEFSDAAYFKRVRLAEGGTCIEWPHGQDIAPHELHDLSKPVTQS